MRKKILIFSGAGLDKESGIETFRDSKDGLWNNHNVKEVASIDGWYRNKESVLNFYNERRRQLNEVEPNNAHLIISSLESALPSIIGGVDWRKRGWKVTSYNCVVKL